MSGWLQTADDGSAGLFLVYERDPADFTCHGFRLIRASSLRALNDHITAAFVLSRALGDQLRAAQFTIRLIHLRYPGQLWATEAYFRCRLEVAR